MSQEDNRRKSLKKRVQSAGLRATAARIATLDVLLESGFPLTHAEVASALDLDKATVFRNLTDMVAAKILHRTELGDRVWRFEVVRESAHHRDTHPHFVCVDCGTVSCAEEMELTTESKLASQSLGRITEILLRGHCNDCV